MRSGAALYKIHLQLIVRAQQFKAVIRVMDEQEIIALVTKLDTTNGLEQEAAWKQLRLMHEQAIPYLLKAYPTTKKWQGRVALVVYCIRFARTSEAAFQLGLLACKDKATLVRYRACALLAYSLRMAAMPHLVALLKHSDENTVEDASAAIDAIRNQNHHYFLDRSHSGRMFWRVNDEDRPV